MREYVAFCLAFALPRLFPARSRPQESIHRAIFAAASTVMCLFAPFEPPWGPATQTHKIVHGMQLGFYLQELLALWKLPQERKRSDHGIIVAHHLFAVTLIILSIMQGIQRFGVAVVLYHEPSDFFLELSKAANYCGSLWQTPLFCALLVTWIVGRFGGLLYIMSHHYEKPHLLCFLILHVLLFMNVYWFYLIIKAAIHRRDPRETPSPPRSCTPDPAHPSLSESPLLHAK